MPAPKLDINRPLTGFLAILLLALGFGFYFAQVGSEMMQAGFVRTGLVLAALWLALPTRDRPAAWENVSWSSFVLVVICIIVFLSARLRWTIVPLILAVAIAVYFLRRPVRRR